MKNLKFKFKTFTQCIFLIGGLLGCFGNALLFAQNTSGELSVQARGTGQTTGHIATLTVSNPTDLIQVFNCPPTFIPSEGKYQSYVTNSINPVSILPGQTVEIPLSGYCADIFSPAAPLNQELPPFSEWISAGTSNPLSTSEPVDGKKNPEIFGPMVLEAISQIEVVYEGVKDELQTPFHSQPEKERETLIQQTFWRYTAALTGKDYKVEQFEEQIVKQYEQSTDVKWKDTDADTQKELQRGISDFWNSCTVIGEKAKLFPTTEHPQIGKDPEDIDDKDDLPQLIKIPYSRYETARALGKNHRDAMKEAFPYSEDNRKKWGDTFKKIYG